MKDYMDNLKRYEVETDKQVFITWAVSEEKARAKFTAKGFHVVAVKVKEIEVW